MKLWIWVLLGLIVIAIAQWTQKQRDDDDEITSGTPFIVIMPWVPNHHIAQTMYQNIRYSCKNKSALVCVFGVQGLVESVTDTAQCRFVNLRQHTDTFVNRLMLLRYLMQKTKSICSCNGTVFVCEYDPSLVFNDKFDVFITKNFNRNSSSIWCPNFQSISGFCSLHHGPRSKSTGIPDCALKPWTKHTIESDTAVDRLLDLRAFVCSTDVWSNQMSKVIDDNKIVSSWIVYGDTWWLGDMLGCRVYQLYETESPSIATRTHAYFGRTDWAYHPWVLRQKTAIAKVQKQLRDTHAWFARTYSKLWTEKPTGTFKEE